MEGENVKKEQAWRGVFAIPCTPFTETGALDLDSLRSQIEFCVEAGAHGIVVPVIASEVWTLTGEERMSIAEETVQIVAGRIPVVIGVSTGSIQSSLPLTFHAAEIGANAIIATPPVGPASTLPAIYDFYAKLSDATPLPIFVQHIDVPYGTRMPIEFISKMVREIPRVDWIKEEIMPPGPTIEAEIAQSGKKLKGIMGGIAGRFLLDEFQRGACGTMPACEATDVHVQVWNALDNGDEQLARQLFNRLLPLLNMESRSFGVIKAVLKRRGIIASDYMRQYAGSPLDRQDHVELDTILGDMKDLFRLAPPW
jgi:4-hydroxy-tetrahydrodipicolinate synthase